MSRIYSCTDTGEIRSLGIKAAVGAVKSGRLVVLPTDTLYGLGCDAFDNDAVAQPHLPVFTQTAQWLDTYFEGADPGFTPPIRVEGSDFKKMVTSIMRSIPFGATSTYAQIAAEVARRTGRKQMSAQAVGGAVGRNPIVLIVPCHRVLASDGSLRGYAGGVDRKEWLLEREGVNMPGLSTPPDADDGGERRE